MGKIQMPPKFSIGDINWGPADLNINTVSEAIFYADREKGILRPNTLPRPDGVDHWRRAEFCGDTVYAARVGSTIYMVADTPVFGYALFKFISANDDATTFRTPTTGGVRPISNERKDIIMAETNTNPLAALANKYSNQPAQPVQPMSLGGAAPMAPVAGEGIGHGIDLKILHSELRTRAYVAGYVMGNAPQLTMSLSRKKAKDGSTTANIMAKESKPSRILYVLMNLPANCVQRNGTLADPRDIAAGAVDYATTDPSEELKLPLSQDACIAYLGVMDHSIPEYAPNVSSLTRQWTAEEILSESNGVSFVQLHPVQNNRANANPEDRFSFRLKSTSGRRSLFTQNNIICLRALEHVPVKCTSEKDAYELNRIAFGAWQYRQRKTESMNALQRAIDDCPSQIWMHKYTIDGEEVEGIGSCFFVPNGGTVTNEAGEQIAFRRLTYVPWWQTGDRREATPAVVTQIVKRTKREASEGKKEAMVTSPVYYAKDPDNKLFQPYARFAKFIIDQGYMSRDKLMAAGTRTSKARSKSRTLTSAEQQALEFFSQRANVESAIQAVQREASDRAVIKASRQQMARR